MNKTTKFTLMQALCRPCQTSLPPIKIGKVEFCHVNRVEKEDGSGHKFNVTGIDKFGQQATVYVETVD